MTSDAKDRKRAVEDTGHSLLVEASAGTGKTSTLIRRILHLVLESGPEGPPLELKRIAAITFTEKAAGEMKLRLRESLEESAGLEGEAGKRARHALHDLETAAITTIHSFAVGLLKERPVEAALDPRFQALDETRSRLLFQDTWEVWLHEAVLDRHPVLERALRAGISPDTLGKLAEQLRQNLRIVQQLELPAPKTDRQVLETMMLLLERGEKLCESAIDESDRLYVIAHDNLQWLKSRRAELQMLIAKETSGEFPWESLDFKELKRSRGAGVARRWSGGAESVSRVQDFNNELVQFCRDLALLPVQRIICEVGRWIVNEFLPVWQKRKQREGYLDFDDQLLSARDLLIAHPSVRRDFQRHFAALLVDEFQDTDPVQLAIVLLLSSTEIENTAIEELSPGPGRLFVVGDPKQSIYRFRGADIETYLEAADQLKLMDRGIDRVQLTTNFRSIGSILRFVDEVFADRMAPPSDGRYQPEYLAFGDTGDRGWELDPPSVWVLPDGIDETDSEFSQGEFALREAERIAKLIHQMIHDETCALSAGKARPEDIAVLVPTLTKVNLLEEQLRQVGISYVLEGGKFYYARSEVSSAITILRAIANPNDRVSVYGALKSVFFGLSDEDLLRSRIAGTDLNYLKPAAAGSPLSRPFSVLRDLHFRRHERPASETFETLLFETGAREVLAARPGGLQSLANLGKLARNLRSLQEGSTFAEVVELLAGMDEEGVAESESRIVEERGSAVRIMTIHKAKGLDFPIVFLASLGQQRRSDPGSFLADPHRTRCYALSAGSKVSGMRTPGWDYLAEEEKKREDAELLRLLYVAMTRARDQLILSTHGPWTWTGKDQTKWTRSYDRTRLQPIGDFLLEILPERPELAREIDPKALDAYAVPSAPEPPPEPADWKEALRKGYSELSDLLSRTPTSREIQSPSGLTEETIGFAGGDWPGLKAARDKALRLGVAFHEAMEIVDFREDSRLDLIAQRVGKRHRLDRNEAGFLEEMMRNCLGSSLFDRVRGAFLRGAKVLRELPYVRPMTLPGSIEEGKLDLLFQEEDGWCVVDYKTDLVPIDVSEVEEIFRARYSRQIRQYADAVSALGLNVRAGYVLLARTGRHVEIQL